MARAEAREALVLANRTRIERAAWKKRIAASPNELLALLVKREAGDDGFPDVPPELRKWKVWDAVYAIPKLGQVSTRKVLREAGVDVSRTLGALTQRQRLALVDALEAVRRPPKEGSRKGRALW